MNTGQVTTNILELYGDAGLDFIPDLISQKVEEKIALPNLDWEFHRNKLLVLSEKMEKAFESSELPVHRDEDQVNEFLVQLRLRERWKAHAGKKECRYAIGSDAT